MFIILMEINCINIFSILYFLVVFILQSTFILINYHKLNFQIIPLVLTNYIMILPINKLINKIQNDKLLIIDLITSFCIHFFSSFYHLCDFSFVNKYCLIDPIKWKYLDYYFSYLMVGLGVQHLLFDNIPIKMLFYFLSVVVQGLLIYIDFRNVLLNLSISIVKLGLIVSYYIYNKNKIIKQYNKITSNENNNNLVYEDFCCLHYQSNINYTINFFYLITTFVSIFVACLGRFYFIQSDYYWWSHSFLWHIFIFTACYLNYSAINYKIDFYIGYNKTKKRSKSLELIDV